MAKEAKYRYIIYGKKDNIATIILNRPKKRNMWDLPGTGGMSDSFYLALDEAIQDDEVKVIIIKGAGKDFSSGHDLNIFTPLYGLGIEDHKKRPHQRSRLRLDRQMVWRDLQKLFLCPKVTIVQIHGRCVGEGLHIAEVCDIAMATEDALIGHSEGRIGLASGFTTTFQVLVAHVGLRRARDLIFTGRLIDGKEAERIGLITRAVPADKLEEETRNIARMITTLPGDSIAIGKAFTHLAYESMGLTSNFTQAYIAHSFASNRYTDGFDFFKEINEKGMKAAIHEMDYSQRENREKISKI